jgi:hypothetical protein
MQGGEGSEFHIPDSELEGSVGFHLPGHPLQKEVAKQEDAMQPDEPARLETPTKQDDYAGQIIVVPSEGAPQQDEASPETQVAEKTRAPISNLVVFSRRTLYVQATIFPLTVLLAFALGYLAGRGGSSASQGGAAQAVAATRVPVEGKVLGDDGALVVILPADYDKPLRLSSIDLQTAIYNGPSADCLKIVEQMGGGCAKAKPGGEFFLYVPVRGSYHVLIIAHSAERSGNLQLDEVDLSEMKRYLHDPAAAIMSRNYRWMTRDLSVERAKPIEVRFGG